MRLVIPFAVETPKTRLADVLNASERETFARAMLDDVLEVLSAVGRTPEVLATAPLEAPVPVVVDDRPLTTAVNAVLEETDDPVAVVMADLALVTPAALERLFDSSGDIVIAPGRGGGTNALVVRHSDFRVDYHGASYLDHLRRAREVSASVEEIDSHRLATDIDRPEDLIEVLLHGPGRARDWLVEAGFHLDIGERQVGLVRDRS